MEVDMELRKAFSDLQRKKVETEAQVKICDAQVHKLLVDGKKNELTTREINSLSDDIRLYKSAGRMFILQPKSVVLKNLKKEKETTESKARDLEAKKTYLIRNVKSSEDNLREMVSQRRK